MELFDWRFWRELWHNATLAPLRILNRGRDVAECIVPPPRMSTKLLASGYWHVRFGAQRFAQWRRGELPRPADFFGWWTAEEMDEAARLVYAPDAITN